MKNTQIVTVITLVVTVITIGVSARSWRDGDNRLVCWDEQCDFYGHDIGSKPSIGEQCGGVCIANPRCTHFTYSHGTCYMKSIPNGMVEQEVEQSFGHAVCGFVKGRSGQPV